MTRLDHVLYLVLGFGLWALATLFMRLAGQLFFNPGAELFLLLLYIVTAPALLLLVWALLAWRAIQGLWRLRATLLLALPGILLDVPVVHYLNDWLPNLAPSLAGSYGAWLLWAYALTLLAALLPERLSRRRLQP